MDKTAATPITSLNLSELETLIQYIIRRVLQSQRSTTEQDLPAPTTLAPNDTLATSVALLQEAIALNTETPIFQIIETALTEYIAHRKRIKVIELFGTIDYEDDHDYKQQRAMA